MKVLGAAALETPKRESFSMVLSSFAIQSVLSFKLINPGPAISGVSHQLEISS